MAKLERRFKGDFGEFLRILESGILKGSLSASYEDGSDYYSNGVYCAVRVYERYSYLGKNRVSLAVTVIGVGNDLFVSAITAGGSQAIFFKINTWGEENFLSCAVEIIDGYINSRVEPQR